MKKKLKISKRSINFYYKKYNATNMKFRKYSFAFSKWEMILILKLCSKSRVGNMTNLKFHSTKSKLRMTLKQTLNVVIWLGAEHTAGYELVKLKSIISLQMLKSMKKHYYITSNVKIYMKKNIIIISLQMFCQQKCQERRTTLALPMLVVVLSSHLIIIQSAWSIIR